ncbi:thymidylate kinase [Diorhabda sublineata]|uniref:thymidylate kinase n=1 Tax=Diorhabda sublineata TaxID=1163346 RepID=UPI0024E17681|nr:thymidylate kinase [Diorhabda sublineata]
MSSLKRGALIVIEGVDRSGKSTQCKKLLQALKNKEINTQLIRFPDRSTLTGKLIDEYLKNKECKLNDQAIHLLFSANRWENAEKMKSLLYSGVTLIVDRYSYSGVVFSAVKKNMCLEWCQQPENGLPKPDLVFLLDVSLEEMCNRPGFGDERYENTNFQTKVSKLYNKLCKEEDNWVKVDAARSIDEVHKNLFEMCLRTIEKVQMSPLETLDFNREC